LKLRRLSKSHLLVLGVFLAAAATALPALAVRAGGEPDPTRFPGGRYFVVGCGFSHRNNDDAIAFPGQPGASHNHTYIGNVAVDAATTAASLVGGESTCGDVGDASAYWVPTLYVGRRALRPLVSVGYYVRRTSGPVQAFPAGLKMIAGGLVIGLAGLGALGRVIESQLVGMTAINLPALTLAAAALLVAGLAACLAPAARAVGINPVDVLKAD